MLRTIVVSELHRLRTLLLTQSHPSIPISRRSSTSQFPTLADAANCDEEPPYSDIPRPRKNKKERKPYPTPMKLLIKRAKKEKQLRLAHPCRLLDKPPDNGLLVPELVPVARRVYLARESLLFGVSKLLQAIPLKRCSHCFEVHVGSEGHEIRTCSGPGSGLRNATHVWRNGGVRDAIYFPSCFHLVDRVGRPRVVHDERHSVGRVPAIVELCIQAGLDIDKFPTKRRTRPVYSFEGRIVDFESVTGNDELGACQNVDAKYVVKFDERAKLGERTVLADSDDASDGARRLKVEDGLDLKELGTVTLDLWNEMVSGTKELMEKYKVHTCGYCPEVQVGPKGHKVRMCKASKHQSRDGLHAWQEATIDDLIGPNYVWHVRDLNKPALYNNLKRYYGKAPAVVELCTQAGAAVPDQYKSMMRLDVVLPDRDEFDLAA
uniref:APO domain-containing protein n=1 Tax=Kalanchoe fedtschenkoi TaxID=63787 RepID=A0A7N0UUC4_KALFE